MNTRMKTNMIRGCVGTFVVIAIFSFLVVGKLISNDFPVKAYLFGGKLDVDNIVLKELSEKRSITINLDKPDEVFHHILVAKTINEEQYKYEIYTSSDLIGGFTSHQTERFHDTSLQIFNVAYASGHLTCHISRITCSGNYTDLQGNSGSGCWCR